MALNPMTPMERREFIDLCAAYALGALDGDDLRRFRETAARADDAMRAALADALKTAANLSLAAPEAAPPAAVKQRLMARVRADLAGAPETTALARSSRFRRAAKRPLLERIFGAWMQPRLGLAAAFSLLVLAAGLVAYNLSLNEKLTAQRVALLETHTRMDALADSTRTRIRALEDSLTRKEAMLEVIRAKGMQMVALGGMEDTARYGKILWDPERKMAILQVSLPPQPDGMDYQLWVIRDNKPMDAGVFQVNASAGGDGMYRIDQLVETDKRHINAFAVTMEPKGGMPQPTGKMYLMGEI